MTFLWGILIGLALGFLAGLFAERRDPGSIITRMLVGAFGGIIGAVVDAILSPASAATSILVAALGVAVLLIIYWFIVGNRKAP